MPMGYPLHLDISVSYYVYFIEKFTFFKKVLTHVVQVLVPLL